MENLTTIDKEFATKLANNSAFQNTFQYLQCRWEDESEYEDINDYARPLVECIKKNTDIDLTGFIKMTKRPFGFKINFPYKFADGFISTHTQVIFTLTQHGTCISWKTKQTTR